MTPIDYQISKNDTDIMKGIAFCAMLIHHLFLNFREQSLIAFKLALVCKACVAIFVFLSGYGLSVQFEKVLELAPMDNIKQSLIFVARRLAKFYLNYWVIFILFVPLGVFAFGRTPEIAYGSDNIAWNLLTDILGVRGMGSYNVTWWFNQLIICLYLLFPFLYLATKTRLIGAAFLVLFFIWPKEIFRPVEVVCSPLSTYLVVFFLGIYLARYRVFVNTMLNKINPVITEAVSIILLLLVCYCRNHPVINGFWGVTVDPFICVFLASTVTSFSRALQSKMKRWNVLGFLGKHSMNMYLTHTFVVGYFLHQFIYGLKNPLLIFFVSLMITLMISVFIETLKNKLCFYNLPILKKSH